MGVKNKHCAERIALLRSRMEKQNFDTVIIASDENRRYLSGYTGEDGSYDETAGVLIITGKDLILACDPRYDTQAAEEAPLYSVVRYDKSLAKELPVILSSVKASRVAVEASRITLKTHENWKKEISGSGLEIEMVAADDITENLRIRKDAHEIAAMEQTLKIAETAFLQFRQEVRKNMTEKEAAWLLEKRIRENGADSLSFPIIAASGPNSALPHAIPADRQINGEEPVIFDFGARYNGYCSDTTRTLIFDNSTPLFEEIYDILFNAQAKAVKAIKPGVKTKEIDRIARDHIDSTRFKGRFGHSLGHGVGIAIHEAPRLSKMDNSLLEQGMIVTVEPGIYIPEWGGIRLENMVMVTDSGARVLNETPYDDYIV